MNVMRFISQAIPNTDYETLSIELGEVINYLKKDVNFKERLLLTAAKVQFAENIEREIFSCINSIFHYTET